MFRLYLFIVLTHLAYFCEEFFHLFSTILRQKNRGKLAGSNIPDNEPWIEVVNSNLQMR